MPHVTFAAAAFLPQSPGLEPWRWKIFGFARRHVLTLLEDGCGPTTFLEAHRLTPLEERTPLLECELGTWNRVLMPITLALYCCGPFFRSGRDHFQAIELPRSLLRQLPSGLYLRLRTEPQLLREYPRDYEHLPAVAPRLSVHWPSVLGQYLPLGSGRGPRTQVALLEESLQSGELLSNEQHYRQKIAIKQSLLKNPEANASDRWLLEHSLNGYLAAYQAGDPY